MPRFIVVLTCKTCKEKFDHYTSKPSNKRHVQNCEHCILMLRNKYYKEKRHAKASLASQKSGRIRKCLS